MIFLSVLVCFMCVNSLMASEMQTYKAGVLHLHHKELSELTPFIHNAGDKGLDILVLPPLEPTANYDEAIDLVSSAAGQAGLYVVAHLYEKAQCQLGYETVRSTLVFDRKGAIVAVYRKAQNGAANCTISDTDLLTFATDFGVIFGVLMEEDLMLYDEEHLKGVKNFVMTGDWQAEVSFFNAAQFAPSWSYITNTNLVSTSGIYSGKAGLKTGADRLAVSELHKNGNQDAPVVPTVSPSSVTFPGEDLRQYVIRQLDLETSSMGYKETVCHRSFCCEFYVKTTETMPESSYTLATFNGNRPFSVNHNIGTQICLISGFEKSNSFFERVSITANFTKQNSQYPIIQSATVLPTDNFKFETEVNGIPQQVTLEIVDAQNLINFGIFGKDAINKLENNNVFSQENSTESGSQNDIYDYIFNEDVREFFDYVWIRLRILIVVVSIYILEMM